MPDDVGRWLRSHGFGKYEDVFAANDIAVDILRDLTESHLQELGVTIGDRIRFRRAIAATVSLDHSAGDRGGLPEIAGGLRPSTSGGEGERRQLTVMFSDLVDSTRLSARLDPEDMQEVLRTYQKSVSGAVRKFDGFVAKFMGDGILIYFGYPQAHENDAERAIRAGLAVLDDLVEANEETNARFGVNMDVRIGIATGPVVVGDIVGEGASEEAAVVGETPNLAARLQSVADANQIVVSAGTRDLLGARFEFEDLGNHDLKGIGDGVKAWRVLGEAEIDLSFDGTEARSGATLVGRQEELGLLTRAWETSRRGRGQVVLVQGEGGIGKSRLVDALRADISGQSHTWVAIRCSPYHVNSMLYPVIEHMKRVFGWSVDDSPELKLKKLETALAAQSLPLDEALPLFASMMSLPVPGDRYPPLNMSSKQMRENILDALVNWLFEEAEKQPVLQVWEDMHWADPTTLDFAELYIAQSPTVPILNVFTYRPEFVPPWTMRSHMTPITLNRLEISEAEALIRNLAKGKQLPRQVVQHITEKADGVPLYVEELTKSIIASDALREEADRYEIAGSLSDIVIPASLHDSLMARLDRLPALREVAQMGAVLGREFAYDMLREIAGLDERQLRKGLQQLVADELLYQRGRLPKARYVFKHALIQDAAYQSLLKRTRQRCHERVARQLEQQFQDTLQAHPELAAHHHGEAGNFRQAVDYWRMAGEQARARSANREAIAYLKRGIDAVRQLADSPEKNQLELKLQLALGAANIVAMGHGSVDAESAYARALELCQGQGDVAELVPAMFGLWRFYVGAKTLDQTQTIAKQLSQIASTADKTELSVVSDYAQGYTALCRGELDSALNHLKSGLAHYDPRQRKLAVYRTAQDPGVACRGYLAMTEWLRGRPKTAGQHLAAAIELADQIDDQFSQAYVRCFVGAIVAESRGDDASAIVGPGLAIADENGFALWSAYGKAQHLFHRLGDKPEVRSIDELRSAVDAISDLGVHINVPYNLTLLARAFRRAGYLDQALDVLADAEQRVESRGEFWWASEVARLTGEILHLKSENKAALDQFQRALAISKRQGALSLELRAAMSLASACEAGSKAENLEQLKSCFEIFTEGKETRDLKAAARLLKRSAT